MIKEFKVKNFKSIKEEMVISLVKTKLKDNTYYNNSFPLGEDEILKSVAFYGMNASGKTSIVLAFAALRELVIPIMQPNPQGGNLEAAIPYYPFSFSNKTKNEPISLEITFSLDNTKESSLYRYGVVYDSKRIIEEKFEKQTSQKYSVIFFRKTNDDNTTTLDIGTNAVNITLLKALGKSIVHNRTFLSMFASFKVDEVYDAYEFFAKRIINITPEISRYHDYSPNKIMTDENMRNFALKMLQAADFNVVDMHVKETNTVQGIIINQYGQKVETKQLLLEHGGKNIDDGNLEFVKESLGTKKIMFLAEYLYYVFSNGSVLIVDELEASLHPELTEFIVKCFLDENLNTHNSQLIFTSHETNLLDLNLFRRDQIYFVYKDAESCGTYIRSLKDFSVRETDSIAKSYLAGRYMTSPQINEHKLLEDYDE